MLAAIAQVLDGVVRPEDVVVLIATGTHGSSSDEQRLEMLGDDILRRWRVVDHDARDAASLRDIGMIAGVPVARNREWLDADVRITTGFVEPHFFAGFSGGPKMVAPGLAALETVLELHSPARIADPRATFGVLEGNPVHDPVRAIAAATGVTFAIDVLIDGRHRVTHAFGGPVLEMHAVACRTARDVAMRPVPGPFDIVITTNSGYPLDRNLYQAVKGMAAAATVVAEGGTIICAAECRDGLPEDGNYARLLRSGTSISTVAEDILGAGRTHPGRVASPGPGTRPGARRRLPPLIAHGRRRTVRASAADPGHRRIDGSPPCATAGGTRMRPPGRSSDDPVPAGVARRCRRWRRLNPESNASKSP